MWRGTAAGQPCSLQVEAAPWQHPDSLEHPTGLEHPIHLRASRLHPPWSIPLTSGITFSSGHPICIHLGASCGPWSISSTSEYSISICLRASCWLQASHPPWSIPALPVHIPACRPTPCPPTPCPPTSLPPASHPLPEWAEAPVCPPFLPAQPVLQNWHPTASFCRMRGDPPSCPHLLGAG